MCGSSRRRAALSAALAGLLFAASTADAQVSWRDPGTRVRLVLPCPPPGDRCALEGTTERVADSTLFVATGDSTVRAPLREVARLEVADGTRTYRWHGAAAGLVAGGGATWIVLNSGGSTAPCDRDANQDAMGAGECLAITAAGAAAGAGLGFLIGGLFGSARWREIPLDQVRVGWVPGRGARLTLRLAP